MTTTAILPPTRLAFFLILAAATTGYAHFVDGGFELAGVQLRDVATPDAFAGRIGAFADRSPGEWVTGGQWDHQLWGGELPQRKIEDARVDFTVVDGEVVYRRSP